MSQRAGVVGTRTHYFIVGTIGRDCAGTVRVSGGPLDVWSPVRTRGEREHARSRGATTWCCQGHTVYVAAAYVEAGIPPCSVIFARIQFFQCALALSCVFRAPTQRPTLSYVGHPLATASGL